MKRTLTILSLYAIAMALLEAVVVVYMRQLYYPENPLDLFPLQFLDAYDPLVELGREAATVVMILTVALLAERESATRCFAAFVFVFGVWDLLYYFWLKVLIAGRCRGWNGTFCFLGVSCGQRSEGFENGSALHLIRPTFCFYAKQPERRAMHSVACLAPKSPR